MQDTCVCAGPLGKKNHSCQQVTLSTTYLGTRFRTGDATENHSIYIYSQKSKMMIKFLYFIDLAKFS
jgi:hypothetical protein